MYYITVFIGIVLGCILHAIGVTVETWEFWASIGAYSLATAAFTVKMED